MEIKNKNEILIYADDFFKSQYEIHTHPDTFLKGKGIKKIFEGVYLITYCALDKLKENSNYTFLPK